MRTPPPPDHHQPDDNPWKIEVAPGVFISTPGYPPLPLRYEEEEDVPGLLPTSHSVCLLVLFLIIA